MARAGLGGGCFWCVEGAYKNMLGIESALPGYAGGHDSQVSYKEVCTGNTGHAESIKIDYDPELISFELLVEVFSLDTKVFNELSSLPD